MKILVRFFLFSTFLLVALLAGGYWWFTQWLDTPLSFTNEDVITINKGDNLSKLAYRLESEGKLTQAKLLLTYAKFNKKTDIKVGEYKARDTLTPVSLLELLQSDEVIQYSVTLIEGKTFKYFLSTIAKQPKLVHTLEGKTDEEILALVGADVDHPEGWFYPDTFGFVSGTSDVDILKRSHKKMRKVLDDQWQKRAQDLPYNSAYEALIMASIVEKETGVDYERPDIAGVFVRRLKIGMRLQTDPTIIYGLGDSYQGNITRKHLRGYTPYNTYQIDGLPPTPIANPGVDAIVAALNPNDGRALYFVAKGDGSHQFSATLREHNKAVREYQLKRRENYRSAPGGN